MSQVQGMSLRNGRVILVDRKSEDEEQRKLMCGSGDVCIDRTDVLGFLCEWGREYFLSRKENEEQYEAWIQRQRRIVAVVKARVRNEKQRVSVQMTMRVLLRTRHPDLQQLMGSQRYGDDFSNVKKTNPETVTLEITDLTIEKWTSYFFSSIFPFTVT